MAVSFAGVASTAGGNTTNPFPAFRIKEERPDDAEINALALKMVEQNKAKLAQAQAAANASGQLPGQRGVAGQTNIASYMNRGGNQAGQRVPPTNGPACNDEKTPIDIMSQKGKFGWLQIGKENIPYIVRSNDNQKYCSVRMVEQKLLTKYLSYLSSDIFSCTCIRSYYITECEAKLLTDINSKHCENAFGKDPFTDKDLVVLSQDANEFYQFLNLCYSKLLNPNSDVNHDRCGFVRINKDSVVPYTVKDSCRYVPLFYFEGETDTLKKQSAVLGPWDLAYLKFCCKVQGIRSELFANDSCQVISLADIRGFFPTGTIFDEYWPPKAVDHQLLVSSKNSSSRQQHSSWIKAPPTPSPTNRAPSLNDSVQLSPSPTNQINGWSAIMNRYPLSATASAMNNNNNNNVANNVSNNRLAQQAAARLQQAQMQQQNPVAASGQHAGRQQYSRSQQLYYANLNQSGNHQNLQGATLNQNHSRTNSTPASRYYSNSTEVIDLSSPPHSPQQQRNLLMNGNQQQVLAAANAAAANAAANAAAANAARPSQHTHKNEVVTWKNLIQIMETPARDSTNFPFKMQKALVNNKMVPCINAKPYLYSELLMTVNDLMDEFFPTVSMHKCKEVLQNVLHINLYAGNLQQKTVLRESGKCKSLNEVLPLIQLKDVLQFMPQLRYIMMSKSSEEQQAHKKQRLS